MTEDNEATFYDEDRLEQLREDDEIDDIEEGFMRGYLSTYEEEHNGEGGY